MGVEPPPYWLVVAVVCYSISSFSQQEGKSMKAIIDGLRYDTQRAERVATHESGHPPDDFHYIEETLYRTENGRWFLHGRGGAMTRYSESVGNGWKGGSELRPLTPDEAMAWLEQHNRVQELETWFAEHIREA